MIGSWNFKLGLKHWLGTAVVGIVAVFVIWGMFYSQGVFNNEDSSDEANLESGDILEKVLEPAPSLTPPPTLTPSKIPVSLPTPTKTPTPTPTKTPSPILSPTSTPTPALTPTQTPEPTPSLIPTLTPVSTSSPQATPNPAPTTTPTPTPEPGFVVINEIAWMGTAASQYGEWIELYNAGGTSVDFLGWAIFEGGGTTKIIDLQGSINPHGYFLIERATPSSPDAIIDITADVSGSFGGSGLVNYPSGEYLVIKDSTGNVIDSIDASTGWFAGDNTTKSSMERLNPNQSGSEAANWHTNQGITKNGLDKDNNQINGTPRQANSI